MTNSANLNHISVLALVLGAALLGAAPARADQVIPDDLIVQGSTCVGLDCVNNETFNFDTIRLKENNLRIKFEDTSVGTYPSNDWQITANDSASGGANYLAFDDITGAKQPFRVTAGAPTASLFVANSGRIGLRTAAPVLDVHVATSNTPGYRLEQNNAGGWGAQTWDIAGNEANFFIRDVTSGSRLPFRIRPGAPSSTIDINGTGNVGIGTANPTSKLHVAGDLFSSGQILFGGGLGAQPAGQTVCYGNAGLSNVMGFCASDIRLKRDINYLGDDSGLNAIMQIKPATFKWHEGDDRVMAGFIAQNVQSAIPAAVTQPSGSEYLGLDTGAVLSYAVRAIQELKIDIDKMKIANDKLRAENVLLRASR